MNLEKKRKANTREKITLLSESSNTWGYLEIMRYFGFSYGKANNLMRDVENIKGVVPFYEGKTKRRVRIDDVLEMFGTTKMKELEFNLLKQNIKED